MRIVLSELFLRKTLSTTKKYFTEGMSCQIYMVVNKSRGGLYTIALQTGRCTTSLCHNCQFSHIGLNNGGSNANSADRWGCSPGEPRGPRPMPILPRQATATSRDFQSYSSSVPFTPASTIPGAAAGSCNSIPPAAQLPEAASASAAAGTSCPPNQSPASKHSRIPSQPTLALGVNHGSNNNSSSKESLLAV